MIILLLFGLALIAVSAGLAVRAVTIGGLRRRDTLAQIASYGFAGPVVAPEARERRGPRAVARLARHGARNDRGAPLRQHARAGDAKAAA